MKSACGGVLAGIRVAASALRDERCNSGLGRHRWPFGILTAFIRSYVSRGAIDTAQSHGEVDDSGIG